MFNLQAIQNALTETSEMHGWIFTNFSHRDSLTDSLLQLNSGSISTRRWVYIIPTQGEPVKIVHAIEAGMLDSLPGTKEVYSGKQEIDSILKKYSGKTFAILSDADISVISTVDAGFVQNLNILGINTISAASLIQVTKGLLTQSGINSHERAATLLYKIINETWEYISSKFKLEEILTEHDVLLFILDKFNAYSLVYHHEPIVAFGKNAGDPHYSVPKLNSAIAQKGDVIQLDIFAKEMHAKDDNGNITSEASIYADISWVGVYDTEIPKLFSDTFEILCKARDSVYKTLERGTQDSSLLNITGSQLDSVVREILIENGYENDIKHRTGHSIDTECHGSGVNLDSVEFPDYRTIKNGSCFSVEPGLYFDDFGMRTEIDIYIQNNIAVVSGNTFNTKNSMFIQQELLRIV